MTAHSREIKASTKVTGARWFASVEAAKRRVKDGQLYFIRRHGGYFRPGAAGYCHDVCAAGVFTADQARSYLSVDGLSVVSVSSMRRSLIDYANYLSEASERLRTMVYAPHMLTSTGQEAS